MMDAGTAVGTAVLGQGSPSICCGGREEEQEGEEAEKGGGASQSTGVFERSGVGDHVGWSELCSISLRLGGRCRERSPAA